MRLEFGNLIYDDSPALVVAPRYAELNPTGTTDIVHVITTLEGPTP